MNKLIRGIGCFIITCIIFACPICLTLLFALGNAQKYGLFTTILILLTGFEFILMMFHLFFEYDKDE
jgi:phosphoglycerol transferase MdoB-like AlkP superfamily enzyme